MSKSEVIESADHLSSRTPDWPLVHFEVLCGRCGQDLHGQEEPVCPQCLLEFDWAHVVPLEQLTCSKCDYHLYGLNETRCPECGESFEWGQVLDEFRRRQKPLFEYHWRKRPFRSFMSSWWLAMRPWKLWRMVDLQDSPSTWTRIVLILVTFTLFLAIPIVADYLGTKALVAMYELTLTYGVTQNKFYPWWFPTMMRTTPNTISILFEAFWVIGLFASLMVLRQSMRKCKVKSRHVFRVVVYAMLPLAMLSPLVCVNAFLFQLIDVLQNHELLTRVTPAFVALWRIIIMMTSVISVCMAYRYYIKMPHAITVGVSCCTIAFLLAMYSQTIYLRFFYAAY